MDLRCITKAYGDEPLERIAVGKARYLVYVVNSSLWNSNGTHLDRAVGFPKSAVFQAESTLFRQLSDAYASDNKDLLNRLWDQASPLNATELPVLSS